VICVASTRLAWIAVCLLALAAPGVSRGAEPSSESTSPLITKVLEFDSLAEQNRHAPLRLQLAGVVRWSNPAGNLIALQDQSGAALVEVDPPGLPLEPGEAVVVEGDGSVNGCGAGVRIGGCLLIDNHGGESPPSATIFLKAGRQPLCVCWLSDGSPGNLEIYLQGPKLARQKLSDAGLFRKVTGPLSGAFHWVKGLDCQVFEGQWGELPDFFQFTPVKTSAANNFDLGLKTRENNVALRFSGYLEVPEDGLYAFSTVCGGASQLFVELPQARVTHSVVLPPARHFSLGQILPPNVKSAWGEAEGLVAFISRKGLNGYQMELSSETGRLRVEMDDGKGVLADTLLGSRVSAKGICRSGYTVDGHLAAAELWVPDLDHLHVLESASERWQIETNAGEGPLPVLTKLGQIIGMKREEAARGYPVLIRGVIVWSGVNACQICDSTAGIYVDVRQLNDQRSFPFRVGDYGEIEGRTEDRFSPVILASRGARLGLGTMPEPAHPVLDQLLNGTMDAQYVEIQGVVTDVLTNRLTLLTRGGEIHVYLVPPMWDGEPSMLTADGGIRNGWSPTHLEALKSYEGALIRLRGSLSPVKNSVTFKVGEIQMRAPLLNVDRAAPADPFDAPGKRVAQLLMFDAHAAAFQPVKITGQIVQGRADEFFLMDHEQGLRFSPKKPLQLAAGDLVEVVGFPELLGPSPVLREAQVRKIGKAALPPPQRWVVGAPLVLNPSYDATRVELQAQLMNISSEREDQVLNLQLGSHLFLARLDKHQGRLGDLPVGGLLDLTGVYAGQSSAPGQRLQSFELLLNSPADVRVLKRPSWWTLKRLATAVGLLVGGILTASIWIALLRRQVEQRTAQWQREIQEREQAEHQHAIEAERSRIAQDLHDDLGSSLTEISLLADAGPGSPPSLERAGDRFHLISGKARSLVNALDVIVWLVNPRKDALPYLANYLASHTEEFLAAAKVACRLKIPMDLPPLPLSAEMRHGLFLAVKESLNNIVRHAHATEVMMQLSVQDGELRLCLSDNGCGFVPTDQGAGDGLLNLDKRMSRMGGRCRIDSQLAKGTTILLTLPLAAELPSAAPHPNDREPRQKANHDPAPGQPNDIRCHY
jgi:signal transduction histidine kinase